jgi:beta-lactamase regulating signal transducer with metallopeptidase domain
MISLLGFVLECAATAAFIGTGASLLALGAFHALKPFTNSWRPARRADAIFLMATAPAALCISVVAAAAAPSLASALGLASDHCTIHRHHLHLCIVHSSGLRPLLAALGAFALAIFLFRAGLLLKRLLETKSQLRALERLGTRRIGRFPVISVPGAPRLCHAVGLRDRRVVVSEDLASTIGAMEFDAALAHEEAHLRRRDPAAFLGLSIASLFAVPVIARYLSVRFQEAAEEACDAEAAAAVADPPLVAAALVKVASLQREAPVSGARMSAFGETALERRVRFLLLDAAPGIAPARAILVAATATAAAFTVALLQAGHVHHAVETALHFFF